MPMERVQVAWRPECPGGLVPFPHLADEAGGIPKMPQAAGGAA